MNAPTVFTRTAWWDVINEELTMFMVAGGNPRDCVEPDGTAILFAEWREQGTENWTPTSPVDMTYPIDYLRMWTTIHVELNKTYEIRGVVYHNFFDGSSSGWLYGSIITLTIPPAVPGADPWVGIGQAWKTGDTTAKVQSFGLPIAEETADLYVQYREVGESDWVETTKQTISTYTEKVFDITGLDPAKDYEARSALDYDDEGTPTTIYSEIVPIGEEPESLECEEPPESGTGTEANPYIIINICQLNWIGGDSVEHPASDRLKAYYELGNPIDATETDRWYWDNDLMHHQGWRVILGSFTGSFDGKGYPISGLYMKRVLVADDETRSDYFGLFSYILGSAKNVLLLDADMTATKSGVGTMYAGVLAGGSVATVEDCCATGRLHATWYAPSHRVNGVGGLIGRTAGGTIKRSHGFVSTYFRELTAKSSISVGGLVGYHHMGSIEDSYSRGRVEIYSVWQKDQTAYWHSSAGGFIGRIYTAPTKRSYSTGFVTGAIARDSRMGGLIGSSYLSTVEHCFWDTQTSGRSTSSGGTGKTTAEMKDIDTFLAAGWDFDTVWDINPVINDGYPFLLTRPPKELGGYIWVEGKRLAYTDQHGSKRRIWGWTTGATGDPGYRWIDGTYIYWVDAEGNVRREVGWTWWPSSVSTGGCIWIEGKQLGFIDASGVKRVLTGSRWV